MRRSEAMARPAIARLPVHADSLLACLLLVLPNILAWAYLYPGYLQPDHMLRVSEFVAGVPSSQHSLLWTLLATPFLYWSSNYALYGLVQIAVFVLCTYRTIAILQELRLVKTKWALALLYGLFPTFLWYNELYCSDIVFSYVVMLLTAYVARFVLRKEDAGASVRQYVVLTILLVVAALLRKNAILIPVGLAIAALFALRGSRKPFVLSCAISILLSLAIAALLAFATHATEDPKAESFAVPSFQIASVFYHDGSMSEEALQAFEAVRSPEEWAAQYALGVEDISPSADYAKAGVTLTPELIGAWLETGMRNPGLYFDAWTELESPFWDARKVAWVTFIDFYANISYSEDYPFIAQSRILLGDSAQGETFLTMLCSEKNEHWDVLQFVYVHSINDSIPPLRYLFILLLFNRALPLYVMLLCVFVSLLKRNSAPAFLAVPVICIWLSLVFFAPVALMRYAMEMYYALPVLLVVCVRCKNRRKLAREDAEGGATQLPPASAKADSEA